MSVSHARRLLGLLVAAALALMFAAADAAPALAGAVWRLDSSTAPSLLVAGGEARVIATASNIGDGALVGSGAHPVVLTDVLPAGLRVPVVLPAPIEAKLEANDRSEALSTLECNVAEPERREVSCSTTSSTQPVAPFAQLRVSVPAEVLAGAVGGEADQVSVQGGEPPGGGVFPGAGPALVAISVGGGVTPFGVEKYGLFPEEEDGGLDVRAGSHPFQLTSILDLNLVLARESVAQPELLPSAPALARNLAFELPPGLLGDPQATPECSDVDFSTIGSNNVNACPADTAVGVAIVTLNMPNPPLGVFSEAVPVFNLTPAPGEPARFGLEDTKVPIILDTAVRTGGDYGVTVTVSNTTQVAQLLSTTLTLWGQPQAAVHDGSRGWACLRKTEVNGETCQPLSQQSATPFLTLPAACTGTLWTSMGGESWQGQQTSSGFELQGPVPGEPLQAMQGCAAIPFSPQIDVAPVDEAEGATPGQAVATASTPVGMNVTVSLPTEEAGLGEGQIRESAVMLPAGVQLNASAANGLQACSESQAGYEGSQLAPDPLSPGAPEPMIFSQGPAQCPDASKIGTVRISSPDLAHELTGGVYLAAQEQNPFASLFAIYIVAEDPVSGIRVKLAGKLSVDEETGQATATFKDTPQVPLSEFKLHFFEGPTASLSTPSHCGSYTTQGQFTPWSAQTPVPAQSTFQITGLPGGGCPEILPFSLAVQAGSTVQQAGAFSGFKFILERPDEDEQLQGISMRLPSGMAAVLASVTPCPEPQASREECGPESLIGHSTTLSGLGPDPVALPGQVYLTGPYHHAPFGIEIVTPAVAGPFNLGNVNVRSTISVDPSTAQVTIQSDPVPTRIKGIPAQIKQLNVTIDRPGFQFNPTNCDPMSITGTLTGAEGASEPLSFPFQVADCASLPFAPKLTAVAGGDGSKANGTSLAVTVTSGGVDASGVAQAGIAKVDLQLPLALSSRLSTLQKACTEATFNANPASCNEDSVIGNATIHTPVLSNPLSGPAYLVSHGGAAFPDVEFVLQGEGITLVLDGKTDIKAGVTYSRFESAPDAPFTVFETVLPAGPHGVLTANVPEREEYSLCKAGLQMPTEITGQNGAVINQSTNIAVTGCAGVKDSKAVKLTRVQLLAKALKACRKRYKHSNAKRHACERQARKTYAAKAAKKHATKKV